MGSFLDFLEILFEPGPQGEPVAAMEITFYNARQIRLDVDLGSAHLVRAGNYLVQHENVLVVCTPEEFSRSYEFVEPPERDEMTPIRRITST